MFLDDMHVFMLHLYVPPQISVFVFTPYYTFFVMLISINSVEFNFYKLMYDIFQVLLLQ